MFTSGISLHQSTLALASIVLLPCQLPLFSIYTNINEFRMFGSLHECQTAQSCRSARDTLNLPCPIHVMWHDAKRHVADSAVCSCPFIARQCVVCHRRARTLSAAGSPTSGMSSTCLDSVEPSLHFNPPKNCESIFWLSISNLSRIPSRTRALRSGCRSRLLASSISSNGRAGPPRLPAHQKSHPLWL